MSESILLTVIVVLVFTFLGIMSFKAEKVLEIESGDQSGKEEPKTAKRSRV